MTVTFDEGEITTDAGASCSGSLFVRERVFGIAQGYEDCNDAATLREDVLFKAICRGQDDLPLASQPTLSRFENRAGHAGPPHPPEPAHAGPRYH